MGSHLIDGKFQSDKYPWCQRGFVPLKTTDKDAQPVLWEYAQAHYERDAEFSDDLKQALRNEGFQPLVAVPVVNGTGFIMDFTDPLAQDLLWEYAQRRAKLDLSFPLADVQESLREAGFEPPKTVTRKVADLVTESDFDDLPLPLSVVPNHMGINLCSVESESWVERGDGQLVSLTIHFVPTTTP